jgi:AcrR family transcriptional regulator
MEAVARRAGVSTKTLYRLITNKAALFEAMITQRIDRFAFLVQLRACEGRDIEAALREALLACAELILDGEVIALQRMILGESDKFHCRHVAWHACIPAAAGGDVRSRSCAGPRRSRTPRRGLRQAVS